MSAKFPCALVVLGLVFSSSAWAQAAKPQPAVKNGGDFSDNAEPLNKVPSGVILVKGAWPSASDSVTPLPESGSVANHVFTDRYFGMSYSLPDAFAQKYDGPPPSDTGRYVLAQFSPTEQFKSPDRATILLTAQDMFFTPLPANDALELVNYSKNHLQSDYRVEMPPTPTKIAGRPFTFFAYWSPVAELHWYVLATEIRCHVMEIVLSSRDTKLLENLTLDLNKMKLAADIGSGAGSGGSEAPVCMKDYAREENMISRVEPVFTEHRYNPVPVRIIIDKEGKIKHIHYLRAFPDQAKVIGDALAQWKFKPYWQSGKPLEVETGILFGAARTPSRRRGTEAATE